LVGKPSETNDVARGEEFQRIVTRQAFPLGAFLRYALKY